MKDPNRRFSAVRYSHRLTGLLLSVVIFFTNWAVALTSLKAATNTDAQFAASLRVVRTLGQPPNRAAAIDTIDKWMTATPRSSYDLDAKADELGRDIESRFAYVRDQIGFEPYEGVLRGGRGALIAGAANSYDKCILLAELLRPLGTEVRFAAGELSKQRTQSLLKQAFASKVSPTGVPFKEDSQGDSLKTASDAIGNLIFSHWLESVHLIMDTLRGSDAEFSKKIPTPPDVLAKEIQHHVWLEFKQNDKWVVLDPTFNDAKIGSIYAEKKEEWTGIPENFFHKVTVRLTLEKSISGDRSHREILRHETSAEQLDATLVALRFDVATSSDTWSATPVLSIGETELKGEVFSGVSASPANNPAGLGARLFHKPGQLPKQSSEEIFELWLDFDFTSPSGQIETVRRDLADARTAVAGAGGRPGSSLLTDAEKSRTPFFLRTVVGISIAPGALNLAGVAQLILPELRKSQPSAKGARDRDQPVAKATPDEINKLNARALYSAAAFFHTASDAALRFWANDIPSLRFYESTPRVALASATSAVSNGQISGGLRLDLRRNALRVIGDETVPAAQLISRNICRGIFDSAIEHVLAGEALSAMASTRSPVSALTVMDAAQKQKIAVTQITDRTAGEKIACAPSTKTLLSEAINHGDWLVAPVREVKLEQLPRLGWWNINPVTGETLSVMDSGLNQTATEYWLSLLVELPLVTLMFMTIITFGFYGFMLALAAKPRQRDPRPNIEICIEAAHSLDEVAFPHHR